MADELAISFDELVEHRRHLQEFCTGQYDGISAFKQGPSFQVHQDESALAPNWAHHLSSSATCHESLIYYSRNSTWPSDHNVDGDAANFVKLALQRPAPDWKSDGSAPIYCRCRTLPLVIRRLPSVPQEFNKSAYILRQHVRTILEQTGDADRLAIGEAPAEERQNWYPPNAYHTFWTLLVLEEFEKRFDGRFSELEALLKPGRSIARLRSEMLVWASKIMGFEMGLHASGSPMADSDQLAWAMTIKFWFGGGFGAEVEQQDFLRFGLKCLFSRQNSVGIWRRGRPLFHYEKAGNAYCYVFETFTYLLTSAVDQRRSAVFLREAFKPYAQHFLRLWQYAVSTRIPLQNSTAFGWSSGHRSNRKDPESWATATVYSYGNCLRRLLGVWTRAAAAKDLPVKTDHRCEAQAISTIAERGDTWSQTDENVATKLVTIFVNPVLSKESTSASLEPDREHIEKDQARGAILFGPPGTSKTALARAIAAAIGWDYVELHASHFVADGLGEVQRTADQIFKRLMQLDRTVILFDEIDELVREREAKTDAFGRFLTTSMLPKLAELWDRRSVIYFVATNHIDYFDSAIVRAQRFDAIVFVPPPSFDRKIARLQELLRKRHISVPIDIPQASIEQALQKFEIKYGSDEEEKLAEKATLTGDQMLAKFLLIRWDQLDELATIIANHWKAQQFKVVDTGSLKKALQEMRDPFLDKALPYIRYLRSVGYERRDYSKVIVWEVSADVSEEQLPGIRYGNSRMWYDTFDFDDLPSGFSRKTAVGPIVQNPKALSET